jgi:hypothetical protein
MVAAVSNRHNAEQVRAKLAYKAQRVLGRAPELVTDSDYEVETKDISAVNRPPQGDFLCFASVNRGGKFLHTSKDVSDFVGEGSRCASRVTGICNYSLPLCSRFLLLRFVVVVVVVVVQCVAALVS